jgi:outer membrane protein
MSKQILLIIIITIATIGFPQIAEAQEKSFSLNDCINYALENSTDIGRAKNSVESQNAYLEESKAARLPNLQLSADQQLSSTGSYSTTNSEWSREGNTTLSVSLNSQVTLYNGAKIKNTIRQDQINLEYAELNIQTEQELIGLNILTAYINVLLAKDNVKNSQLQLDITSKQLLYAEARKDAGSISLSDLLIIKSQLASDKTSLIESESDLRISLVSLMQLMNMPVSSDFDIQQPNIDELIGNTIETDPVMVYEIALGIQPSIKTATLNVESNETGISIAKADALPKLTLNGGMDTGYGSSIDGVNFGEQFSNKVNPYVGLSLSVPIFQQKQTKTLVKLAQIQVNNSELELIDMKNDLRKYIEQACTDAQTAQSNYQALQEQLDAENESYQVANEMFTQGMMNSVDYLLSKNNLIVAENEFTQARYNLILQNKIVEYYLGNKISL